MKYMGETPVMMVVPEMDMISPPVEQIALFDTSRGDLNQIYVAPGKGHLNVMSGDGFTFLAGLQVDFVKGGLAGQF